MYAMVNILMSIKSLTFKNQTPKLPFFLSLFTFIFISQALDATTFKEDDINANEIQFAYNTKDDECYVGGMPLHQKFADSVTKTDEIVITTGDMNPAITLNPSAAAPEKNPAFIWEFQIPENYEITSLDVGYRLTLFPQAPPGSSIVLSISADGQTYTPFATLQTTGEIRDEFTNPKTLVNLTPHVFGQKKYYIKGEFICPTERGLIGRMQIFRTGFTEEDASGYKNSFFINKIGVTKVAASKK